MTIYGVKDVKCAPLVRRDFQKNDAIGWSNIGIQWRRRDGDQSSILLDFGEKVNYCDHKWCEK
jgi:hypothetical protein